MGGEIHGVSAKQAVFGYFGKDLYLFSSLPAGYICSRTGRNVVVVATVIMLTLGYSTATSQ